MSRERILALPIALAVLFLALPVQLGSARRTLVVAITCEGIADDYLLCHADVDGGTGPYTYQWGPAPLTGSGEWKRVACSGIGSRTISVTVTDVYGDTGSYSDQFLCN